MAADKAKAKRLQALFDMAATVDVRDVCGSILSDPERAMVSLADKIALAIAFERAWGAALEAHLLVTAIERAGADLIPDPTRRAAVDVMTGRFRAEVAELLDRMLGPAPETTAEET